MWNEGNKKNSLKIEGELSKTEAQNWLSQYCRQNPSFLAELLMFNNPEKRNISISPVQDLIIRSFFLKDFSIMVAGRGFSKTWTASVFAVLYCICNPGSKIGICSAIFRQSRLILEVIEGFIKGDGGEILRSMCQEKNGSYISKNPDSWRLNIGDSLIVAIPLNDNLRGYRFDVIIMEEMNFIPSDTIKTLIMPMLSTSKQCKFIGLSSSGFKSSNFYKDFYKGSINLIKKGLSSNHCVWRFSYKAAPDGLYRTSLIDGEKNNISEDCFNRVWMGMFTDDE